MTNEYMKDRLEEIQSSYQVLYDGIQENLSESEADDRWVYKCRKALGQVCPEGYKSLFTMQLEHILKVIDIQMDYVNDVLESVNKDIKEEEEEEYDKQLSRECEFPEWYYEKPYAYTANGEIY